MKGYHTIRSQRSTTDPRRFIIMSFTPVTVTLPARSNTIEYDEDTLIAVIDALEGAPAGEGVQVDVEQESDGKARTRTKAMKDALAQYTASDQYDGDALIGNPRKATAPGKAIREHTIKLAEHRWLPVLSLRDFTPTAKTTTPAGDKDKAPANAKAK